jgi:hypothetical protein
MIQNWPRNQSRGRHGTCRCFAHAFATLLTCHELVVGSGVSPGFGLLCRERNVKVTYTACGASSKLQALLAAVNKINNILKPFRQEHSDYGITGC